LRDACNHSGVDFSRVRELSIEVENAAHSHREERSYDFSRAFRFVSSVRIRVPIRGDDDDVRQYIEVMTRSLERYGFVAVVEKEDAEEDECRGRSSIVTVRADRGVSQPSLERRWIAVVAFDGGLGNRLFQAAFALGCARPRGDQNTERSVASAFAFHKVSEITHHSTRTYFDELFRRFPADGSVVVHDEDDDVDLYYTEDTESSKRYDPRAQDSPEFLERAFMADASDGMRVLYRGRFVNPAYFDHCRDELREILRPEPSCVKARLDAGCFRGCCWERCAFLHVRLGDYVGDGRYWNPASLSAFYDASLRDLGRDMISSGHNSHSYPPCVLIFSDGTPEEIRRYYPMLHARIAACGFVSVDVREDDELTALYAMARCGLGGVVPNSTFSWWAAFIGRKPCYHFPASSPTTS
jgi:hypothetical protein